MKAMVMVMVMVAAMAADCTSVLAPGFAAMLGARQVWPHVYPYPHIVVFRRGSLAAKDFDPYTGDVFDGPLPAPSAFVQLPLYGPSSNSILAGMNSGINLARGVDV